MKKTIYILLFFVAITGLCNAQNLIAINHNGSSTFETKLDSAVAHAQNGDTIYIPGGFYSINTSISKQLHIIGAGHHPDSAAVSIPTYLTNPLYLITGASGSSITGIYIQGNLYFGNSSSNANVSNCIVSRCNFMLMYFYSSDPANIVFTENIITDRIILSSAQNNFFYNNVIVNNSSTSFFTGILNCVFKNNIFLSWTYTFGSCQNSTFENNIFISYSNLFLYTANNINNIFKNNLFSINFTSNYYASSICYNNIINQSQSSICVNQTGYTFNYAHDYHLKSTCPGKNAGTDGTDIGIYGGSYPWKEGGIPYNPHIQSKLINAKTNSNGTLPVQINVKAQDN